MKYKQTEKLRTGLRRHEWRSLCSCLMIGLFALGVMLAFNVGDVYFVMSNAVIRNPITIALVEILDKKAPAPLPKLANDVLLYIPFSLYASTSGILASLIGGLHRAMCGVAFWVGYVFGFICVLCGWAMDHELRTCLLLAPSIIGTWCTVPVYVIGVAFGRFIHGPSRPCCTLLDLIALVTAFAMLGFGSISDSDFAPPLVFLVATSWISVRVRQGKGVS